MPENTTVVKEEVESTPTSTTASEIAAVVKEEVSSTDTNPSPAELAKGFEAAVKEGFEKATSQEPTGTEQSKEEATSEEGTVKADEVDDKKTEQKAEDKGPIPYDRFQKINTERQQFEQQLTEQKDFVEAQRSIGDFCLKNNISNEDFSYWLNVAAAIKNDPAQAKKLLEPHLTNLKAFDGEVFSPELQAAIDTGEVSLDWAKKHAAMENRNKFSQQQTKLTREQQVQQEQQRYVNEAQTSFTNWAKTKANGDPDFQPKASADAEDGKYEFVLHKMNAEYATAGLKSVQDLLSFADRVYTSVNKSFGRFTPHKNGSKVIKSNQSTSVTRGAPKTFEEAIAAGARAAGISFTPKV